MSKPNLPTKSRRPRQTRRTRIIRKNSGGGRAAAGVSLTTMTAPLMAGTLLGPFSRMLAAPVPFRFRTSLEFAQAFTFTTGAVANVFGTERSFYLNSIYRPDPTLAVNSTGFAALTALYAKWRVHRTRVRIVFNNAANSHNIAVGILPPTSAYTSTGVALNELLRSPYFAVLPIQIVTAPGNSRKVEKMFSMPTLSGLTKTEYDSSGYNDGVDTAAPAHKPLLIINAAPIAALATTVIVTMTLIMDVEFFEPDILIA